MRPARSRRGAAWCVALGLVVAPLAACSGDDGDNNGDGATSTTATSTTETTVPEETTTVATYIVPEIDAAGVPEICEATKTIAAADTALSELLVPILSTDASPEADQALLQALPQVTPLIEQAQQGYARMAAVLPADLAADARKVSEVTKAFWDSVVSAKTIEEAIAAVDDNRGPTNDAREASAHLEATVKAKCNLSLYG